MRIIATDVNQERLQRLERHYGFEAVEPEAIYDVDCDIFCPCAIGGILNDQTIPRLKCKVVAGCANNQLQDEQRHGRMLHARGILYAPDFVINAGGVIQVIDEIQGFNPERVKVKTEKIYQRLVDIFEISRRERIFSRWRPPAAMRSHESRCSIG